MTPTASASTLPAAGPRALARSYAYCERLARRSAGNFYHAFRILPAPQRRATCALYAFLRIADDLSDGGDPVGDRRLALASWRDDLDSALNGDYSHPVHPALHDAVVRHAVPPRHLEDALTGVEMDLDVSGYETFEDLYRYCYHVASAVGMACLPVWGYHTDGHPAAEA